MKRKRLSLSIKHLPVIRPNVNFHCEGREGKNWGEMLYEDNTKTTPSLSYNDHRALSGGVVAGFI
jgi:hypothetical protein